ncbi:hypothetical protein KP509_13G094000 [Ceratopteris richardii]|nr:hypothetical protein KP509_13G094000 [Ceratopteris richardii]
MASTANWLAVVAEGKRKVRTLLQVFLAGAFAIRGSRLGKLCPLLRVLKFWEP